MQEGLDPSGLPRTFHWSECAGVLGGLVGDAQWVWNAKRRCFESQQLRVSPPLVFPVELAGAAAGVPGGEGVVSAADMAKFTKGRGAAPGANAMAEYLAGLPAEPALQCLILMQAGAVSLGMFEFGEVLATKTIKRYVVRGKGRAQPTHLKTKGKSRYGSRLRLQNAKLLVEELNDKLHDYFDEFGAAAQLFVAAPTRLWPDVFRCKRQPPFEADFPISRVPLDLPIPTTDTLLRTYKALGFGRIESLPGDGPTESSG